MKTHGILWLVVIPYQIGKQAVIAALSSLFQAVVY